MQPRISKTHTRRSSNHEGLTFATYTVSHFKPFCNFYNSADADQQAFARSQNSADADQQAFAPSACFCTKTTVQYSNRHG